MLHIRSASHQTVITVDSLKSVSAVCADTGFPYKPEVFLFGHELCLSLELWTGIVKDGFIPVKGLEPEPGHLCFKSALVPHRPH